jgi:hypothetical protein
MHGVGARWLMTAMSPSPLISLAYSRSRNPQLQAVLARAAAFFSFAAALWALLPLISAHKLQGSPNGYAILLSCIGVGAVSAAFTCGSLWPTATCKTV